MYGIILLLAAGDGFSCLPICTIFQTDFNGTIKVITGRTYATKKTFKMAAKVDLVKHKND